MFVSGGAFFVFRFCFFRRPGVARSALSGLLRLSSFRPALLRPALLASSAGAVEIRLLCFQTELFLPSLSTWALLLPLV